MDASTENVSPLRFGPDGLISVVAQDAESGDVLMVGFMNEAALAATRETGRVHYWSRSRNRLWRKGETSGHEQVVERILVNCEENSLLLKVRQIGAVCHDGYPTCYYRALESTGALTVTRERAFDPQAVYAGPASAEGEQPDPPAAASGQPSDLATLTDELFAAFAWLRDHDLTAVSTTSVLLRADEDRVTGRVTDELRELAGVLDGSHRHDGLDEDALLEGSQVWYWVILAALRARLGWHDVRPDRALAADAGMDLGLVARLLHADADRWDAEGGQGSDLGARCHATLALVAHACLSIGADPRGIIERELRALETKPYLRDYFAGIAGSPTAQRSST